MELRLLRHFRPPIRRAFLAMTTNSNTLTLSTVDFIHRQNRAVADRGFEKPVPNLLVLRIGEKGVMGCLILESGNKKPVDGGRRFGLEVFGDVEVIAKDAAIPGKDGRHAIAVLLV